MHYDADSLDDRLVLGVEDVARLLGRTPASIRHAVARKSYWLPPSFLMGTKICWRRDDIVAHINKMASGEIPQSRVGRPRNPRDFTDDLSEE